MSNQIKYVIIQAGGLGSRLEHHTTNKPKCLIEFRGKTLLQRQLELFHDKKIIIIGDYKLNILKKYIDIFMSNFNISIIDAQKLKGTLSGLNIALKRINDNDQFAFIWSDLIFEKPIIHANTDIQIFTTNNYILPRVIS